MKNLCLQCPREIRGLCCHISIPLEGFNVILDHVACPLLKNGKCTNYKQRVNVPYCIHNEKIYDYDCLPEGCLYLKGKKPKNPKVQIKSIIDKVSVRSIGMYNLYNNIPFKVYEEHLVK